MRNKNLMMYPVSSYIYRLKTDKRMEWIKENWMKVALITGIATLMLAKDFNLQMDLKAPNYTSELPVDELSQTNLTNLFAQGRRLGTRLIGALEAPVENVQTFEIKAVSEPEVKEVHAGFSDMGNTYSNMTYEKPMKLSRKEATKIARQQAYVKRFVGVAQAEMKKFGIPASITLAQGLIESNAGDSRLSKEINNHFGMKCFSRTCKKGHCKNFTDDTHKDFFRAYGTAWESYRAHSIMLQGKRYQGLKEHGKNYKAWAHGLKKAGYATDKRYALKLIHLIESLELHQYDQ